MDGGAVLRLASAEDVLHFWFEATPREAWFEADPAFDAAVRSRFEPVLASVSRVDPARADLDARSTLAAVIILDQFPRNIYRGTPDAFATDALARRFAHHAIASGFDRGMDIDQRGFLYLPFEHSEDLADQTYSISLYTALGDAEYLRYAIAHQAIIQRFGRFPHRNAILGRPSTPEEIAFLQEPGSAF